MPMTQDCIRKHYEQAWQTKSDSAADAQSLGYSNPVEDAVLYPLYRQMIADLKINAAGNVLDVGAGSGRWIRFFLDHYRPRRLVGADYTLASVELLRKWFAPGSAPGTELDFKHANITDPCLDLGGRFDLINIANVLFHIPEQELFTRAMNNLARHIAPDGIIATTEYLPRTSMRTEWMLVRDRYSFEQSVKAAGLRIVAIKAFSIFSNDPMGLDGPSTGPRGHFLQARAMMSSLCGGIQEPQGRQFVTNMLAEIENAVLSFCRERIAEIDMPSQKLVFLARA
jgi:SAM-dependent methyltransferase